MKLITIMNTSVVHQLYSGLLQGLGMKATYNGVTPTSLGQKRKERGAKKRKNEDRVTEGAKIPLPPSFPPPGAPPVPPPSHLHQSYIPGGFSGNDTGILPFQEPLQPWKNNIQTNVPTSGLPGIPAEHPFPFSNNIGFNSGAMNTGSYVAPKPEKSGTIPSTLSAYPYLNNFGNFPQLGSLGAWNAAAGNGSIQAMNSTPHSSTGNDSRKRKSSKMKSQKVDGSKGRSMPSVEEIERRRKRAARFNSPQHSRSSTSLDDEENFANLNAISTKSHKYDKDKRIVGRCQALEKSYLRLTSEPNPDLVRPLNVLKKTYAMLTKKHQKRQASYQYLCDQFKSMRQDLRVQMIENQFAVKVYEAHARIALENDDIGEFNQCQSRLITLFELPSIKPSCLEEFTSYRVLYYMLTEDNGSINTLRLKLMTEKQAIFNNAMVQTAFKLAHARLLGDYHNFMRMYAAMKTLGKKLVDAFIEKEKLKSLVVICKSYNQIKLDFLTRELQFKNEEESMNFLERTNLRKYIITKNAGEDNELQYLDTKACRIPIGQQYSNSRKIDIKGQQ